MWSNSSRKAGKADKGAEAAAAAANRKNKERGGSFLFAQRLRLVNCATTPELGALLLISETFRSQSAEHNCHSPNARFKVFGVVALSVMHILHGQAHALTRTMTCKAGGVAK